MSSSLYNNRYGNGFIAGRITTYNSEFIGHPKLIINTRILYSLKKMKIVIMYVASNASIQGSSKI